MVVEFTQVHFPVRAEWHDTSVKVISGEGGGVSKVTHKLETIVSIWIIICQFAAGQCLVLWLVYWSVGWFIGWLVGCLVGCLVGWLVGWLVYWSVGWLVGWLVGLLVYWSVGWFSDWFIGWLVGLLVGWLVGWFIGCLVGRLFGWSVVWSDHTKAVILFYGALHACIIDYWWNTFSCESSPWVPDKHLTDSRRKLTESFDLLELLRLSLSFIYHQERKTCLSSGCSAERFPESHHMSGSRLPAWVLGAAQCLNQQS